jgi:hypothetical protein
MRGRSQRRHDELVAAIREQELALAQHLGGIVSDLRRRIEVRRKRGEW